VSLGWEPPIPPWATQHIYVWPGSSPGWTSFDVEAPEGAVAYVRLDICRKEREAERKEIAAFLRFQGHGDLADSILRRDHQRRG
jgi:hypothetical protein